jgi:hypothetical protein
MDTIVSDRGGVALPNGSINHHYVDCRSNFVFIEISLNLDETSDVGDGFMKARIDCRQHALDGHKTFGSLPREKSRFRIEPFPGKGKELIFSVPRELAELRGMIDGGDKVEPFSLRINLDVDAEECILSKVLGITSNQIVHERFIWTLLVPLAVPQKGVYWLEGLPRLLVDSRCNLLWVAFGQAALWADEFRQPFIHLVFKDDRFRKFEPEILGGADNNVVTGSEYLSHVPESRNGDPVPVLIHKIIRRDSDSFLYREDEERCAAI